MHIIIASDHAGFELKQKLVPWLQEQGHQIDDLGPFDDTRVDYPDFAQKVAQTVLQQPQVTGLILCGTGIGASIAANRFKGIRCALCHDVKTAELARQHNNANILALGARILDQTQAFAIVERFLETEFEGGRHEGRLIKIDKFGSAS